MPGPFYKYNYTYYPSAPTTSRVKMQMWYTQSRPYKDPLPYLSESQWGTPGRINASSVTPARNFIPRGDVDNMLYKKFRSRLGESAENLVNLAEYNQARMTVVKRATQIGRFVRSLKRLDFVSAANELGLDVEARRARGRIESNYRFRPRYLRRDSRSVASNYLEYAFGWKPLINDIYTSTRILLNGIPGSKVSASATRPVRGHNYFSDGTSFTRTIQMNGYIKVRHGAIVQVSNPNLWLLNQLGLINPVAVAWELVPFSFVVDWFVNIGDILNSISDFAGLTLTREYTSARSSYTETTSYRAIPGPNYHPGNNVVWSQGGDSFERTTGPLTRPTLRWTHVTGLSAGQGASAIALIVQQLPNRTTLYR